MLKVHIENFTYSNKQILKDIKFTINTRQHLAVLGESGSGKSTLLHLIYGLLDLPNGEITWERKRLLGASDKLIPGHEFMKLVAQEYDIMPFISVAENIGSFLSKQDVESDEKRIDELLEVVDMRVYKKEYVKNLSGGQKQRVALAKALAKTPQLLLLDEPFSHIDRLRKTQLRRRLFSYLKENNIGCIYATHDSDEALAFSDKMLFLSKEGKQKLFDTPEKIYHNIESEYQASFFGEVNDLQPWFPSLQKRWYYANELLVTTIGPIEGKVVNSYFKGAYYLIEIKTSYGILYVEHFERILPDTYTYITVKELLK